MLCHKFSIDAVLLEALFLTQCNVSHHSSPWELAARR
jgi:hypothetical protein